MTDYDSSPQLLTVTTSPAGHPSSEVLTMRRPGGIWLRLQQDGRGFEAFLRPDEAEALIDVLIELTMERDTQQRRELALRQRVAPDEP